MEKRSTRIKALGINNKSSFSSLSLQLTVGESLDSIGEYEFYHTPPTGKCTNGVVCYRKSQLDWYIPCDCFTNIKYKGNSYMTCCCCPSCADGNC
jgi:hypothetical protein